MITELKAVNDGAVTENVRFRWELWRIVGVVSSGGRASRFADVGRARLTGDEL